LVFFRTVNHFQLRLKQLVPTLLIAVFILITGCSAARPNSPASTTRRQISLADLRDRIRGGWAGKMIGVSFGGPTEFGSCGILVPTDKLPTWTPEMVKDSIQQDDLYVQMSFAETLDAKGLNATSADFAEGFAKSQFELWHTSLACRRNLRRGVSPEETGTPTYTTHGQDISFQILCDFLGLACPAMPVAAETICDRASRIEAWGDGMCAGRFICGAYSEAFFETDPEKIIRTGLACVPPDSDYAHSITDVLQWHKENPDDWQKTWKLLTDKYGHSDLCPNGAAWPLSIDAKLNGGYVALALLYGGDDFTKTMTIATRCGQDSDCNPSTASGIWGAAHGYSQIPAEYTSGIAAIADMKFEDTLSSFNSQTEATYDRAIAITKANGGHVEGDHLIIAAQQPLAPPVRNFPALAKSAERISCTDSQWKWTGPWRQHVSKRDGAEMIASDKDAEATITFTGVGAIIVGPYIGNGGKADVYLDGKFDRTIDAWPDADRRVVFDDVWHKFYLPDGPHTLRLVLRGERMTNSNGTSNGTEIRIDGLVVFQSTPGHSQW
jgi:hypothetical protein